MIARRLRTFSVAILCLMLAVWPLFTAKAGCSWGCTPADCITVNIGDCEYLKIIEPTFTVYAFLYAPDAFSAQGYDPIAVKVKRAITGTPDCGATLTTCDNCRNLVDEVEMFPSGFFEDCHEPEK